MSDLTPLTRGDLRKALEAMRDYPAFCTPEDVYAAALATLDEPTPVPSVQRVDGGVTERPQPAVVTTLHTTDNKGPSTDNKADAGVTQMPPVDWSDAERVEAIFAQPRTLAEADAVLRNAGYDPEKVGEQVAAFASAKLLAAASAALPEIKAEESAGAMLIRLGMDGQKWAKEFRETALRLGYPDMDVGWLIGWFCNAIMAGYDHSARAYADALAEAQRECERLTDQVETWHENALRSDRRGNAAEARAEQAERELGETNEALAACQSEASGTIRKLERERDEARAAAFAEAEAALRYDVQQYDIKTQLLDAESKGGIAATAKVRALYEAADAIAALAKEAK